MGGPKNPSNDEQLENPDYINWEIIDMEPELLTSDDLLSSDDLIEEPV